MDVKCPFCGEDGFDVIGLKGHLVYDCDKYDELEVTQRYFVAPRSFIAASPASSEGEGAKTKLCPDCDGRCVVPVHAPDCTDTECSYDCPEQKQCERCKGTGNIKAEGEGETE